MTDYKRMTSPCGLDCFNCILYLANDNEAIRQTVAKKLNMPEDKVQCEGCRNHEGIIPIMNWKTACDVYRCINEKDFDFCYECDDFPCDNLHPLADRSTQLPHNTKVFNLALIKKMGLENWAENKAKSVKDTYYSKKINLNSNE